MTRTRIHWLAVGAWIFLAAANLAAEGFEITIERSVPAKMRDGVTLRADIYRPKADGKFPVLLQRTPYDKRLAVDLGPKLAKQGYVVVVQDTRGRFASEGDWYPFRNEALDGYDTVEWAAALPYSNGKVGMFGGSYVGITQLMAAITSPPHLAGIFPVVAPSNLHDGVVYQGGAFEQLVTQSWTPFVAIDTLMRQAIRRINVRNWAPKLPLASFPILDVGSTEGIAPHYLDWLLHPDYDDYWKPMSFEEHADKIQVPGFHFGGWYDIFAGGTLRNYFGIKARGGSEAARRGQRVLMGPWFHGPFTGKTGEVDFGSAAQMDADELMLRWYDYILKGAANGLEREKPVKIFVMGANVWREEDDWPLARARSTRYYLHSGGKANSLRGDGSLSTLAPQNEPQDQYVYDPADPVPTRGGGLCCSGDFPGGAFDQRAVEAREDVLVYTTPEFKEEMEVTGPVTLELYASSSAVDTDFTGKLVDVWPNGFAQNLTDGILRARYRNSREKPEMLNPDQVYKFTLDLWPTANVFRAGHKLRLEVSSSNFPRFDRNLNTGELPAYATRMVKATNKIYHDREHPSALILPVVPR